MSSGIAFLALAVALSVVGSLVVWWRQRRPTSTEHDVESFARRMRALAAPVPPRRPSGPRRPAA